MSPSTISTTFYCVLTATCLVLSGCQSADEPPSPTGARPALAVSNSSNVSLQNSQTTPQIAGSRSCRECHERFYELWAPSHHGLAMQPYTTTFAAANLTPQNEEIRIGDYLYRAATEKEEGWVTERGPEGERQLPIAQVLGGKNVYYFLTPWERGRLQTLPVAYDVRKETWFDTASSAVRHIPGGPKDVPLHWTDRAYTFNTSCYSCHVSQLENVYDRRTDTYRTSWKEPGINCEVCHGPAAEHVRVCREAEGGDVPEDLHIIRTQSFTPDQTNSMCASCHARLTPLTTTFVPGDRYFDHFDLVAVENLDFYPDGRDLGENYTMTTWRMSPCLASGELDCVDCHTSSGRFRFHDNPNAACLPCHKSRVESPTAHTHHPVGSVGNECISCHMPMTTFANMRRSDHSMRPPTPATTLAYASPNACNLCHTDQDATWADRLVRQWHAEDYQAPVLYRAGLVDAARKGEWKRLPDIFEYINRLDRDEVTATGLIRLLSSCPDERKWQVLVRALQDPSPLVRASAVEGLNGYLTEETLQPILAATADEYRLVRVRAAFVLAAVSPDQLPIPQRQQLERANKEFLAAMTARPDDHASAHTLGVYYAARGENARALSAYETAHRLEPRAIEPLVNCSLTHYALGQKQEAEQCLREALEIDPASVAANLNLGMLLGEMGRLREAEEAFRAAVKADPESAQAAYNLAVLVAQRDPQETVELCRTAARLQPQEPRYAFALAFYLQQAGKLDQAIGQLQTMVKHHPGFVDAHHLLGSLLIKERRRSEAADVFQKAANNLALPTAARRQFEARLRSLAP